MKSSIIAILLAFSINCSGQAVNGDPAMGNLYITDLVGNELNANTLVINVPVLLHVPLYNNFFNAIPYQTTKVRVTTGSKIIADPTYPLATAPMSEYYTWSSLVQGGATQINGDPQIADVPADFIGEAVFRVIPNVLGNSTITGNYSIVNNHPTLILNDLDPNNNTAQLTYSVVTSLPVDITKVTVIRKGCNINVNFLTSNEINVHHYEIETSKDGVNFVKVGTVTAANRSSYINDFALTQAIKATNIFVRVKSVDNDGQYKYSSIEKVSGTCDAALLFNIYPNPVIDKNVSIRATSGIFDGRYNLTVIDMGGKIVTAKQVDIQNLTQYSFDLGNVSRGKYILKVVNLDGSGSTSIPFEKL